MASDFSLALVRSVRPRAGEPELLERAANGDHDAYASLVRPHEHIAYRIAAAITGSGADAEEAVQNGFVKAYRSLDRFRAGAAFRPWLLRIVTNEAHNVLRSERRHARLGERAAELRREDGVGTEDAVVSREEIETVLAALRRLPERDRVVVALRYFAELPDREAAEIVGASAEAYRVRLVRARRRLQALLEDGDG